MNELRKDYILDKYVIIASNRSKRPHDFKQKKLHSNPKTCPFCPNNEHMTPPEIKRVEDKNKWKIRVVPNKFGSLQEEGNAQIQTDNKYFTYSAAYGRSEVLIETPNHKKDLEDLSIKWIKKILEIYGERVNAIQRMKNIKYVSIFKNSGATAGASLTHPHTQIMAYNIIPRRIKEKIDAIKKIGGCPYCEIIEIEKKSFRKVFENNTTISFTPYASRQPFEVWIFPKRHVKSIVYLNDDELKDLAEMLKNILLKLKKLNLDYNFYLQNSPEENDMHFHVEIMARIPQFKIAGWELSTDTLVNPFPPEDAAKFYRGD